MPKFTYTMSGLAAKDQTWETTGKIETPNEGQFPEACNLCLGDTFQKLTKGQAVFGNPGLGCRGPYKVTKFTIEVEKN